jgi:8-oxo-dGTP pyrophosphatase MutT (NUDIX family)
VSAPREPSRMEALRQRVVANLAAFEQQDVPQPPTRRAAVVIALTSTREGDPVFLLTKRSPRLNTHGGQWALPGGKLDPGETDRQAALRELDEELGLPLPPSAVLGHLDDYATRSGFVIAPLVVWAGLEAQLEPDPNEVDFVVPVPLTELDREDSPRWVELDDARGPIVQLPIGEHRIHAPTAAILYQFREVALHGRATRVAHFDEPGFARR